jgi:hypothetical protein
LKIAAIASPARSRASPSNTTKRQGASLPWSGTREAMASMASISSVLGPGAVMSKIFGLLRVRCRVSASIIGSFLETAPPVARRRRRSKRAAHRNDLNSPRFGGTTKWSCR